MMNSEARKRLQEAASNSESALSQPSGPNPAGDTSETATSPQNANQPIPAPVDSGAIGDEARFDLIEQVESWMPTGEGFANPQAWAIDVAGRAIEWFANVVVQHTDHALAEVELRLVERQNVGNQTGDYNGGLAGAIAIVRNYRQEHADD